MPPLEASTEDAPRADASPADAADASPADPGDNWFVRPAMTAATPPMGWSSWNAFHCSIDEPTIEAISNAMVSSGMKAAGYEFVNIDDCWAAGARDAQGNLPADPTQFPDGMKAVVDHIHANGLKAGLYTTVGAQTCAGRPGSQGYTQQDANNWASWGVDYAKIDWCGVQGDPATNWMQWHDALLATGRPITYSICTAGRFSPTNWAYAMGNLWRTTDDINPTWSWMLQILDMNEPLASLAGPGHWNDPDMLEVGNSPLDDVQDETHLSLWAMMAAPLISGNDLRSMPADVAAILTNAEVIAVDQDPIGYQGYRVSPAGSSSEVWVKPLQGSGSRAVALFNRGTTAATLTVSFSDIGLQSGAATVRDLWAHTDLGTFQDSYSAMTQPNATMLLRVEGTSPALPHGAASVSDLGWTYAANYWGPAERDMSNGEQAAGDGRAITIDGTTFAKGIGCHAGSLVRVRLGGRCTSFSASVGVDDEVTGVGTVDFQVWADGDLLVDTGVVQSKAPAKPVAVDVTGKNELRLYVGNANDGNAFDHADWGNAQLKCAP
jgi:alpha-galactosidase